MFMLHDMHKAPNSKAKQQEAELKQQLSLFKTHSTDNPCLASESRVKFTCPGAAAKPAK
jgi:hypothetical protein